MDRISALDVTPGTKDNKPAMFTYFPKDASGIIS
jgi:hypothetical protein